MKGIEQSVGLNGETVFSSKKYDMHVQFPADVPVSTMEKNVARVALAQSAIYSRYPDALSGATEMEIEMAVVQDRKVSPSVAALLAARAAIYAEFGLGPNGETS